MELSDVLRGALLAVTMTVPVRVFLLLVVARIRLADILWYVGFACVLFTAVVDALEQFGGGAAVVLAAGLAGGVGGAAHTLRERACDPEHVLTGFFFFGRVPPATKNWFGFKNEP